MEPGLRAEARAVPGPAWVIYGSVVADVKRIIHEVTDVDGWAVPCR